MDLWDGPQGFFFCVLHYSLSPRHDAMCKCEETERTFIFTIIGFLTHSIELHCPENGKGKTDSVPGKKKKRKSTTTLAGYLARYRDKDISTYKKRPADGNIK